MVLFKQDLSDNITKAYDLTSSILTSFPPAQISDFAENQTPFSDSELVKNKLSLEKTKITSKF